MEMPQSRAGMDINSSGRSSNWAVKRRTARRWDDGEGPGGGELGDAGDE
jgi:hypothetical protein